jgi:hypothetical protein
MKIHHLLCTSTALHLVSLARFAFGQSRSDGDESSASSSYGIDVSFPIHKRISTNYPWLPHNVDPANNPTPKQYEGLPIQPLGNRQEIYNQHLKGCREFYDQNARQCDVYEYDRMLMNMRQPMSMQNYTEVGFLKTKAPKEIVDLMTKFWDQNHLNQEVEAWPEGNTYINSWNQPTYMLRIEVGQAEEDKLALFCFLRFA